MADRGEQLEGEAAQPSTSQPDQATAAKDAQKPKTFRRIDMPSQEQMIQEDFMNNCATRTVVSGVMGMGLGVMFGIFFGTMDSAGMGASMAPADPSAPKQTTGQAMKQMFKTTRARSWSYSKGFGAVGALFAGSECVIEKQRAKHDIYNSVYAGCFSGGVLARSGGPQAMCLGCATFAAFSAAIDYYMER